MTEGQHAIDALSFEQRKFPPSPSFVSAANAGDDALYQAAAADHEGFWAKQALDNVTWSTPFTKVCEWIQQERKCHPRTAEDEQHRVVGSVDPLASAREDDEGKGSECRSTKWHDGDVEVVDGDVDQDEGRTPG